MVATQAPSGASGARALDGGRVLAGLGAVALLISLFLDWYGRSQDFGFDEGPRDTGISAWTAFELTDILLAALALAVLAWVVEGIVRPGRTRLPARLGTIAGPAALVLVLVSIINEPPVLSVFDPTREVGAWVALAGALLMTIGALLRLARISLVVSPRDRDAQPDPARQAPAAADPASPEAQTETLGQEPGLPPPPR